MTQRWSHGELALKALEAGKNVYSAVPMAISAEEIAAIVAKVEETGLIYMMGETSYYNPAVIYARQRIANGAFGRVFYSEGDYVHDMDNGFSAAYQFSGGEDWKPTASFPPMLYPTHAIGGVLGALPTYATTVSKLPRHRRPRGRRHLREVHLPLGQRLLQHGCAVRARRRRRHAHQRVPPRGLLEGPRVPLPLLRHRGGLRAVRRRSDAERRRPRARTTPRARRST